MYRRLLQSFLNDLATLVPRIDALLPGAQPGDRIEAGRLLHTVKGLAATLGAQTLSRAAQQAEQELAAAQDGTAFEPLLERLRDAAQTAQRDLASLLLELGAGAAAAGSGQAEAAPAGETRWRSLLLELSALLRGADMQALELYEQIKRSCPAPLQPALQPLDEAMAALDFEQALACCQALITEPRS